MVKLRHGESDTVRRLLVVRIVNANFRGEEGLAVRGLVHLLHARVVEVGVREELLKVVLVHGRVVEGLPGLRILAQLCGAIDAEEHEAGVGHVDFGGGESRLVEFAAQGERHGTKHFRRLVDFILYADNGRC